MTPDKAVQRHPSRPTVIRVVATFEVSVDIDEWARAYEVPASARAVRADVRAVMHERLSEPPEGCEQLLRDVTLRTYIRTPTTR